ncbi:unnamed protein product [Effrenium voratum]|nr:unnamed protein product [Effrenium voratum]
MGLGASRQAFFAIDLPASISARGCKYLSICSVDGQVVAVPYSAKKILVVDASSRQAFAIDLPAGITAGQGCKYLSSCSVNGQVVAVPYSAEKILVVDASSRQAFAIDLPAGITAGQGCKYLSICSVDGQVVAVPCSAEKILVVDASSRQAFAIDLPAGITAGHFSKYLSSCSVNGQVVAVPYSAEKILVVDASSRQAFAIDLPAGITAGQGCKYLSICSVDGQVVAVPCSAEKILVVDASSRQAFAIDLPAGITAGHFSKYLSSCSVNGQVVAVPYSAEKILVVDASSRQAFAMDLPAGITAGQGCNYQSSCSVNGQVVAVPDNAENILVVDASSRQAFAIDLPAGITAGQDCKYLSKYLSICSVNGQVVAVPYSAKKILVVDFAKPYSPYQTLDLHTSDVHNTPQFVDLVAAVLSSWIYTDEPEPPQMAHVTFKVHIIIQPGDLGRAVKIASVTAHLPREQVLFIVFKGTSYILDFLSWNLEYDHGATNEVDFFAHSGAASVVKNSKFLKCDALLGRLVAAEAQGVQKVAFTGHSLGGMYAQMSLFLAWAELEAGSGALRETLLKFKVRCFAFGAPMVFGGNSDKAKEFKRFARDNAVNYIHANDPCPRAWGALNLRDFVQQAAEAAKTGLRDTHGSIGGRVASAVVDTMAAHLLGRPDFSHLEDLARKYEHFIPLRVLSTQRQHVRWKEFRLTPGCLEDHSVVAYVNRLFDAFDTSRPACHVHAQTF